MPADPSLFLQAHRLFRQNAAVPVRQWRLSLLQLAVFAVPMALVLGAFNLALIYGPQDNYELEPIYEGDYGGLYNGHMWIEDPLFLIGAMILLTVPLFAWLSAAWWRSQQGGITLRVPLRAIWHVMLVSLIPLAISMIGFLPYASEMLWPPEELTDFTEEPLLVTMAFNFAYYWVVFRLSAALVQAAQSRGLAIGAGWRLTAPDNKLLLYLAWDLTLLTTIFEAVMRFFQRISDARWERALETEPFELPQGLWLEFATGALDMVFVVWMVFVELALIWALAQRYRTAT